MLTGDLGIVTLPELVPDVFLETSPSSDHQLLRLRFPTPKHPEHSPLAQGPDKSPTLLLPEAFRDHALDSSADGQLLTTELGIWMASQSRVNVKSVFSYIICMSLSFRAEGEES